MDIRDYGFIIKEILGDKIVIYYRGIELTIRYESEPSVPKDVDAIVFEHNGKLFLVAELNVVSDAIDLAYEYAIEDNYPDYDF